MELACLAANSTGRQWELHLQERAEEDLWGRQTALPECLQHFHSHAHTASPASFLCELALDPGLFAVSFSKLQIHPTFALVNTGQKSRMAAWLPSDLVLTRPLLLFFWIRKMCYFSPLKGCWEKKYLRVKCRQYKHVTHHVFNLCSHKFQREGTSENFLPVIGLYQKCHAVSLSLIIVSVLSPKMSCCLLHPALEAGRCVAMEIMHRELGNQAFKKQDK